MSRPCTLLEEPFNRCHGGGFDWRETATVRGAPQVWNFDHVGWATHKSSSAATRKASQTTCQLDGSEMSEQEVAACILLQLSSSLGMVNATHAAAVQPLAPHPLESKTIASTEPAIQESLRSYRGTGRHNINRTRTRAAAGFVFSQVETRNQLVGITATDPCSTETRGHSAQVVVRLLAKHRVDKQTGSSAAKADLVSDVCLPADPPSCDVVDDPHSPYLVKDCCPWTTAFKEDGSCFGKALFWGKRLGPVKLFDEVRKCVGKCVGDNRLKKGKLAYGCVFRVATYQLTHACFSSFQPVHCSFLP